MKEPKYEIDQVCIKTMRSALGEVMRRYAFETLRPDNPIREVYQEARVVDSKEWEKKLVDSLITQHKERGDGGYACGIVLDEVIKARKREAEK